MFRLNMSKQLFFVFSPLWLTSFQLQGFRLDLALLFWCEEAASTHTQVQHIAASDTAFAALRSDGTVVTWGHPSQGGDSRQVQDLLRDVQQIQANKSAFAAILQNGTVVTWGDPKRGGDCTAVESQLVDVQRIEASKGAFAAICADGVVRTRAWRPTYLY